ncbi:MAG TPA: M20/M25/M40 family metallo-hydrolase [Solirubrobacteraceae bacterium]|nr:M20/M25/M40 family metallo-hydrolase [Solirubrobacteraceae bacterium]
MRRASEAERRALNERFADLCRIPSPSGREAAMAERVAGELREAGVAVERDATGNLLARLPARHDGARSVLLCAHLDTVPHAAPIEPVLVDGGWESAGDTILGADNKAAVAVLLAVARRVAVERAPVGVELLFTVGEETALRGAKAFDARRLRSQFGYVFDHASPIGDVVVASPTYYRFEASFHGRAAHAGIRPEAGRSAIVAAARAIAAMPLGRLDEETTTNVAWIGGGVEGTNVVPERCTIRGEARSLSDERVEAAAGELVDRCYEAANDPACECDVDVTLERLFGGYRHRAGAAQVVAAERALRACGYEPRRIATGGGSDANALEAAGFACTNLANGTEHNHEPAERVSVVALEGMLDVALELLETSAAVED